MVTTAANPFPLGRSSTLGPVGLVLLVGCMISVLASGWFWREAERLDQARFSAAVTSLVEQLDSRTERYAEQLERLGEWAENRPDISAAGWNELVKKLEPQSNLPAFVELTYATNTLMPSRAAIEKAQRSKPRLSFLESPRLEVAHRWISGTTLTSDDTQQWLHTSPVKACWWATASGRPSSSPRRLVPHTHADLTPAVSLFVPVFATDFLELNEFKPENSRQLRHHRFQGLVIGTISWKGFLETALPSANEQVDFDAFADADGPAQIRPEAWMGASSGDCRVFAQGFNPRFQTIHKWPFFRNHWQLVFYTTQRFDQHSTRYRAWFALAGGMMISTVMAGAMAVQLRARLRQEVVSRELQSTVQELEATRRERERLSHDLHDGTIQALYALQLGLSRAADQAAETSPSLGIRLTEYRRNLTTIIGELRGHIVRRDPDEGPQTDLAGLLTALVERMRCTTETGLFTEVSHDAAELLTSEQSVHWANLAHEALSNALRHSEARRITVALRNTGSHVTMEIRDDGNGFDPTALPRTGVGLLSMKKRAASTGGTFELESLAGIGTRVSVTVPVTREPRSQLET